MIRHLKYGKFSTHDLLNLNIQLQKFYFKITLYITLHSFKDPSQIVIKQLLFILQLTDSFL